MKMRYVDALPERAETLSGVLDHGFELYTRGFKDAAILLAISGVPAAIFTFLLSQTSAFAYLGAMNLGAFFRNYWWAVPIWIGTIWFTCIFYGATFYLFGLRARGQAATWKSVLRPGLRDSGRLLLLTIMSLLIVALAMVACGVWIYAVGKSLMMWVYGFSMSPIVGPLFQALALVVLLAPLVAILGYFSVPILLAPCTLLLLGQGVFSAIGSGFMLMGQHFWRSVLVFSVPSVLLMVVMTSINISLALVMLLGSYEGKVWYELLAQLIGIPAQALLLPILIAASVAHFSDLLIRREGRDLAQQLEALS
jgi:hypothetical protein